MDSIVLIIPGITGIVVGIIGKKFYNADVLSLSRYRQESSTWSGRLVFIVVGVLFIAIGIKFLVDGN